MGRVCNHMAYQADCAFLNMIGVNTRRMNRNGGELPNSRVSAEAPIPQDGAAINRNGDVDDRRWQWDLCEGTYTTKIGLGQHKRRAHKEECNDAINTVRKKSRWSDEEVKMLARYEVEATRNGLTNINQILLTKCPNRTLDAIKSRRKNPDYRKLVADMLRNDTSHLEASPEDEIVVEANRELVDAIRGGLRSLEGNNQRSIRELKRLANDLINGESIVNLSPWISSLFPNAKRPKGPCHEEVTRVEKNGKRRRRQEYALLQKIYQRDFGSAVRRVLTDQGKVEMPPANEAIDFWTGIFEGQPIDEERTEGFRSRPGNRLAKLWSPVTTDEVKACELDCNSAPRLDGIKVESWRRIDIRARTLFFNLIMSKGYLENDLKIARTVLIPKGIGKITPGNTRPLSITSVVTRHMHKILARRMKNVHTFSDSQRAFIG